MQPSGQKNYKQKSVTVDMYTQSRFSEHFVVYLHKLLLSKRFTRNLCKQLEWYFHRTDVLPDDQPTASEHWINFFPSLIQEFSFCIEDVKLTVNTVFKC